VSDSPGLLDFAIRLVNSVLNLPDWGIQITEELLSIWLIKNFFGLVEMTFGLISGLSESYEIDS